MDRTDGVGRNDRTDERWMDGWIYGWMDERRRNKKKNEQRKKKQKGSKQLRNKKVFAVLFKNKKHASIAWT